MPVGTAPPVFSFIFCKLEIITFNFELVLFILCLLLLMCVTAGAAVHECVVSEEKDED